MEAIYGFVNMKVNDITPKYFNSKKYIISNIDDRYDYGFINVFDDDMVVKNIIDDLYDYGLINDFDDDIEDENAINDSNSVNYEIDHCKMVRRISFIRYSLNFNYISVKKLLNKLFSKYSVKSIDYNEFTNIVSSIELYADCGTIRIHRVSGVEFIPDDNERINDLIGNKTVQLLADIPKTHWGAALNFHMNSYKPVVVINNVDLTETFVKSVILK